MAEDLKPKDEVKSDVPAKIVPLKLKTFVKKVTSKGDAKHIKAGSVGVITYSFFPKHEVYSVTWKSGIVAYGSHYDLVEITQKEYQLAKA